MKKLLFTLMLMLTSAIALNAQSLTGKQWYTNLTDEEGTDIIMAFEFDEDGTCILLAGSGFEMKEDGVPIEIVGSVAVPGTYSLRGKDLKMNFEKGMAEVELDYEIKGMDAKTKAMLDKEIGSEIEGLRNEFKNDMLDGLPDMLNLKIVSLKSRELVVKDEDGEEITFYTE